jgi:iron complex transport system ATP-binding protein
MKTSPRLACHDVAFAYGRHAVLRDVDFSIEPGAWIGLIGPNGVGKTTLMHLLVGALAPTGGAVKLDGDDLARLPPESRARRLAVVPQARPLVFGYTAAEMVAMGRHPHRGSLQWHLTREDREQIAWALELTGTRALASRRFNELSGGEQQLVVIARALAQSTETLLLDEPTAALDLRHQAEILNVLQQLRRERGTTIFWIAHDLNLVGRLVDRLVLLSEGRIAAEGRPDAILTEETLSRVYGTSVRVEVRGDGRRMVDLELEQAKSDGAA